MTILFDATRKVKTARRVFGQGIPVGDCRQPYSAADLAWAAANLNASATDYAVVGLTDDAYDRMAAEAAEQSRMDQWPARRGLSKDANEEAAERYGIKAIEQEYPDDAFPCHYDEYDRDSARYSIMLSRLDRAGR